MNTKPSFPMTLLLEHRSVRTDTTVITGGSQGDVLCLLIQYCPTVSDITLPATEILVDVEIAACVQASPTCGRRSAHGRTCTNYRDCHMYAVGKRLLRENSVCTCFSLQKNIIESDVG
jgi:hypothetical protein